MAQTTDYPGVGTFLHMFDKDALNPTFNSTFLTAYVADSGTVMFTMTPAKGTQKARQSVVCLSENDVLALVNLLQARHD